AGEVGEAARHGRSLAERSAAAGDRVGELSGRIAEANRRLHLDPRGGGVDTLAALLAQAIPVFAASRDALALWNAGVVLGGLESARLSMGAMQAAMDQSIVHARRGGLARQELLSLSYLITAHEKGPKPASEVLAWLDRLPPSQVDGQLRSGRAWTLAMVGS